MEDFETRLITERDELTTKLDRLGKFLDAQDANETLHTIDRDLLDEQWNIMQDYLHILNQRIERLKK